MKLLTALTFLLHTVFSTAVNVKDCSDATEWDAIVVGAGLAGSIIAAKLATNAPDKCILVAEGGKHSGQVVDAENALIVESNNRIFEDGYKAVHKHPKHPETFFNTPGIYDVFVCWDRKCDYIWGEDDTNTPEGLMAGKLVGGSGSLNGALMQYPPETLWDSYPEGWKAGDMKVYLDEIHATMGATVSWFQRALLNLSFLTTSTRTFYVHPILLALTLLLPFLLQQSYPSTDGKHYNDERGPDQIRAAMEAIGFVEAEDAAYWKPAGGTMGIPRVTTSGGRRASSTSVYLKPVLESQSNIKLSIDTDVREIVLSGTTATGLKAVREGKEELISLAEGGLVVVSGGGVKTPQLLLQSGIGPGMKVANDAVGKNLSDKPMRWFSFDVPGVEGYNLTHPIGDDQERFAEKGEGPLAQFGPLLVGFVDVPHAVTVGNKMAVPEKSYPTEKFKKMEKLKFTLFTLPLSWIKKSLLQSSPI